MLLHIFGELLCASTGEMCFSLLQDLKRQRDLLGANLQNKTIVFAL